MSKSTHSQFEFCFSYNELTKNQGGFNMKTIFENNGGAYTQVGDYLLPNLSLPVEEKETNIED